MQTVLDELAYAWGGPTGRAKLRTYPEDFQVEELLGYVPDGEGEHVWLWLEKTACNTDWLASTLAKIAGVRRLDVGYAGMKDRNAVTKQWFSVALGSRAEPDWQAGLDQAVASGESVRVLTATRHSRKLKTGGLKGNRFTILLREVEADQSELSKRLEAIAQGGVPNYFGAQRFGHQGKNLSRCEMMFAGQMKVKNKHQRGLYLSAGRSYLFNQLLHWRVSDGSWIKPLSGDVMMLAGTNSVFAIEQPDQTIQDRLVDMDIHISGPMWGAGQSKATADALALEASLATHFLSLTDGLAKAGLKQERRSLRMNVKDFTFERQGSNLLLNFALGKGSFATSLIRELVETG